MEANDFQIKTDTFLTWLSEAGIRMSPKMQLKDLRSESRGRGAVATDDFEEDEIVFSIPRSAVLNIATALPGIPTDEMRKAILSMPSWLALTALIISEGVKKDSKWSPYLAVLPQQLDSLVFWSDSETRELQASAVVNKIEKAKAEGMFAKHITPLRLENCDNELCHRVASIIMAYAFDIPEKVLGITNSDAPNEQDGDELVSDDEVDEPTVLSMVPLADMLNADAERNNVRLCCDSEDLEMRSIRPISSGEELFNDYGSLPRSDLLRRYGYITNEYSIYDVVEVSTEHLISLFRNGGQYLDPNLQLDGGDLDKRVELCQREDIYDLSYDLKHSDSDGPSIPDELLALLFILLLNEESLAKLSSSQIHLPSRSKLEAETIGQVLVIILQLREEEYATTLEEDEALLKGDNLAYRIRMAIEVRLGEKRVLREAIQEARAFSGSNKHMRGGQSLEQGEKIKRTAEESSQPTKKGRFR